MRNPGHVKLYIKCCSALNISTNHRALPRPVTTSKELVQGNLDGVVIREMHPPTFSTAGLIDYIVQLIVEEDEVSKYSLSIPPFYLSD